MVRVLFICHGNICRSVSAQYIFEQLIREKGVEEEFFVDSAATSTEEIGNPIYPPMRSALESHGVPIGSHRARQVKRHEYEEYDYIIAMDEENVRDMLRLFGGDPDKKIHALLGFAGENREVADPWYTGNFDETYEDVLKGCKGLLQFLEKK